MTQGACSTVFLMHPHHSILIKLLLLILVGIGICLVELILIFQDMKEDEDDEFGDWWRGSGHR